MIIIDGVKHFSEEEVRKMLELVKLYDSQWVNIVNHENCWADYSKEDAVHEAVKMAEERIKRNVYAALRGFESLYAGWATGDSRCSDCKLNKSAYCPHNSNLAAPPAQGDDRAAFVQFWEGLKPRNVKDESWHDIALEAWHTAVAWARQQGSPKKVIHEEDTYPIK